MEKSWGGWNSPMQMRRLTKSSLVTYWESNSPLRIAQTYSARECRLKLTDRHFIISSKPRKLTKWDSHFNSPNQDRTFILPNRGWNLPKLTKVLKAQTYHSPKQSEPYFKRRPKPTYQVILLQIHSDEKTYEYYLTNTPRDSGCDTPWREAEFCDLFRNFMPSILRPHYF